MNEPTHFRSDLLLFFVVIPPPRRCVCVVVTLSDPLRVDQNRPPLPPPEFEGPKTNLGWSWWPAL